MKRERENELMLKGAMLKVTEILKGFNEIMNSTLGDTVTITSSDGKKVRKATLQDSIDLYQNEWCGVVEELSEIGIELEENNVVPINSTVNHKEVYEELQKYSIMAQSNGAISYLEYNDMQIPYNEIIFEKENGGDTSLCLCFDSNFKATILLKNDCQYKVIDKTGDMEQPLLIKMVM